MGTFTKTQSVIDNQYSYVNESLSISGNYFVDAATGDFKSVSGSAFEKGAADSQGEYIGSFSGGKIGDEMHYSFSQMTKEQSDQVWSAVKEMEPYIIGEE